MTYLIPESATRLQATAFVSDATLSNIDRGVIIRSHAKGMAEMALRKLLRDCIKTENYQGYMGQTLYLDAYVLSSAELHRMLSDAWERGYEDSARWAVPNRMSAAPEPSTAQPPEPPAADPAP